MAARELRHKFLARIARANKIRAIALAHHADDQVELFFLRVLRGAGGEGLAGMKWRSPSPADKKIVLVRPLLEFSKSGLLAFARENKIAFRDDATNFSTDFLRNRLRNELLPQLQKDYQPGLVKTVLRAMEIVGAESEFVGAAAQAWLDHFSKRRGGEAQTKSGKRATGNGNKSETPQVVSCNFDNLPVAVQRKVLQLQLTEAGVVSDFELIEQLRVAAGKFVSVGGARSVARDATGIICCNEKRVENFNAAELKLKLSGRAGRVEFGARHFNWRVLPQQKIQWPRKKFAGEKPARLFEFFDADRIGGEIILRHWHAGDRFQPMGLPSAVKLQDLFVNAKIPAARRRELVLATTAAGEIFWVEGLRIGEQFKLVLETKRQLRWQWSKLLA
jgi:tRNA(Ile)-lysidine synthase